MKQTNLTKSRLAEVLALEKITAKDLERLNPADQASLGETVNKTLHQLGGTERDRYLEKIDQIITACTKSDIWEHNHRLINDVVSDYLMRHGAMPPKTVIARETGLSRQTVTKHLAEYKNQPEFAAEIDQFKFIAPRILAQVFRHALQGNIKAARLYFDMVGAKKLQQAATVINEQNNFIQINGTKLNQQKLQQLSPTQLQEIERIVGGV